MEGNTYKQEFKVRYSEVNTRQEASVTCILKYLEEIAINHSESVGFGVKRLMSLSLGWVLSRWHLKIDRYPKLDEEIVVETWPSSFDKFFATREFRIWDMEGKVICRASSLWLLINLERRRPIRVPEDIRSVYGINTLRVIGEETSELKQLEFYGEKIEFDVRRSDIDTNNHVNNVVYLQWIMEGIPNEIYENYTLKGLEMVYKKETSYGESIYVNSGETGRGEDFTEYMHSIEGKGTGANLVLAKTLWEKQGTENN